MADAWARGRRDWPLGRSSLLLVVATIAGSLALDWATFTPALAPLGITPWNPSHGLCVAIVLRAGLRFAPMLAVAPALSAFLVHRLPVPWPIVVLEGLTFGLSFAAAIWVLTRSRWRISLRLETFRDLLRTIVVTSTAAAVVAVVYNLALLVSGHLGMVALPLAALRYWIGDVIGILVMVPFVLLFADGGRLPEVRLVHLRKLAAVLAAIVLVFGAPLDVRWQLSYVLFLPIVWFAVRAGIAGASVGLMLTQIGVMVALHLVGDRPRNISAIQALMLALACVGLIIGVLIDERGRNERHLRRQQDAIARASRTGALGEVTTTLAHELNQPLTAAGNYSRAALAATAASPPDLATARDATRRALDQIERGARIVVRLRDFIRGGRLEIAAEEIGVLIDECVELVRSDLDRSGVELAVTVPRDLPPVAIDRLQIAQVIINLIRNAIEAVESRRPPAPLVRISAEQVDPTFVEVTVADNGPGFPADFVLRPNSPVESTKIDGLGIGLSLSLSIVESHGGRMFLSSASSGASVRFLLPVAAEPGP